VANILRNPIYTGYGIANRYTLAVYNMRSPNSPVPVKVDPRVLATRKMPQQRVRPRQQWFEQAYPMLADLLGPELKVLAVESHARRLNAMGAGRTPKFSTDRHGDSRYILKHILRSKQGGHAMTGRTLGPRGRRKRYYAIQRAYHVPQGDKTLRRLVPAEPIEQAVLTVVRDMLAAAPDLRDQVRRAVNRQLKTVAQDTAELTSLQRQRDELREQLEFVIDTLGTIGKEAARRKIEQLEAQLKGLNERIAKATSVGKIADADEQVEAIVARLAKLHDLMDGLPPAALRQLLSAMIYRLEVDLEMRTVELEVALLSWTDASKNTSSTLCLDGKRPWPLANEAQHGTVVLSVAFGCDWSGKRKCFECRRLQRAA
jgi:hypothetical protein